MTDKLIGIQTAQGTLFFNKVNAAATPRSIGAENLKAVVNSVGTAQRGTPPPPVVQFKTTEPIQPTVEPLEGDAS